MARIHRKFKAAPVYKPAPKRDFVIRPRTLRLLAVASLWLLTLAAYSNSFQAGLLYDNTPILLKDARVHAVTGRNLELILTKEYWYPPTGSGLYRPLSTLSYLFNYAMLGSGSQPAGYHIVNYLLHCANVSLAFALGLLLFGDGVTAFAMAAMWAVHPVLTESVTNVIGRADLLAGFGILAALLCVASGAESRVRGRWLVAASVASAIGIFSKESGIVVIAAVAIYDFVFLRAKTWRWRATAYAAVALPCLVYLGARQMVLASSPAMKIPFTDNPITADGFWTGRLTAIKVAGRGLALLVWPARLSCDYSYRAIPVSTGIDGGTLAGAAVLLGLIAVLVWCYRHRPAIAFLIAFGLAAFLPTSNLLFPIGTIMAERFLYLPALALAGCLAALALGTARRFGVERSACAVLAVIVLGFGARTFARNFDWKDEHTLWTSAEAAYPTSYRPHTSLAEGDLNTALRETNQTLAILDSLPDRLNTPIPYINAGKVYSDAGDSRKAIETLLRAKRIQSALDPSRTWFALASQLGHDYLRVGQFAEARTALEQALHTSFAPELLPELAMAREATGDARGAAVALFEALENAPQNTKLAARLVELYTRAMPQSCAVLSAGTSYGLNRDCPVVKEHMCTASVELLKAMRGSEDVARAAHIKAAAARSGCAQ